MVISSFSIKTWCLDFQTNSNVMNPISNSSISLGNFTPSSDLCLVCFKNSTFEINSENVLTYSLNLSKKNSVHLFLPIVLLYRFILRIFNFPSEFNSQYYNHDWIDIETTNSRILNKVSFSMHILSVFNIVTHSNMLIYLSIMHNVTHMPSGGLRVIQSVKR